MHDLLLTVGFFALTRLEFNTTSIAAILTIVGYSLNETVVVLDRIREMMPKISQDADRPIDRCRSCGDPARDHDRDDRVSRPHLARRFSAVK